MSDQKQKKVPNVSGSFQNVGNKRQQELEQVKKENELDEQSLYYARLFMED